MNILDNIASIQSSSLTVSSTAKPLASDKVLARQLGSRCGVTVINNTSGKIYVGGKDVSAANGIPVAVGETLTIPVNSSSTSNKNNGIFVIGSGSVGLAEYFK